MRYCQWIYRLDATEEQWWGTDAVRLALASRSGAGTAPSFVLSKQLYIDFFTQPAVKRAIEKACKGLSVKKGHFYAAAALEVRQIIQKATFPANVQKQLNQFYKEFTEHLLVEPDQPLRLALFSSGGNEQQLLVSQLVSKPAELEKTLKQLFSLLFADIDLYKRLKDRDTLVPAPFGVVVQYYPLPEASGVAFCHDLQTHDDTTIHIQAGHSQRPKEGLYVSEDTYRVDKKSLLILSKEVQRQYWAENGEGKFVSPKHLGKNEQTLTEEQVTQLARQVRLAQSQFEKSMQFEWLCTNSQFWFTQVKPLHETACCATAAAPSSQVDHTILPLPILIGLSGALGWSSGPVRSIHSKADWKKLRPGEVVVVEQLHSKDIELLPKAAGIICEVGTSVSPEGEIAKHLGIPAVVGTGQALALVKDGQMVTVDGLHGVVYSGVYPPTQQKNVVASTTLPVTGTKIIATIIDPVQVEKDALATADGIGLLRSEFILRWLGVQPEEIVKRHLEDEYSAVLAEGVEKVLTTLAPRPVLYQFHDLAGSELLGIPQRFRERHEPNPSLGYRGAHRLLQEPDLMELEITALADLRAQGLTNFGVMIPMARSLAEVKKFITYLEKSGLNKEKDLAIWVRCETPSLLIVMEDLCKLPIRGVCFDVPSLSQFILGIDKENRQMAHHLNQAEVSVEQAISYAVAVCREAGVASSLVAEIDELRPEIVQSAVEAGVTAISVAPSQLTEMHALVAAIEQKMILNHLVESQLPAV